MRARLALATFVALSPVSLAAQTPTDLARSWIGTFRAYPTYVLMKVNLSDAGDGTLKADVRMEPLVGRTGGPMGVFTTAARYDAGARSFELIPGQDAYRTTGQMVPPFLGVLDPTGTTIAGLTGPENPAQFGFFIMKSAGTEGDLLEKARELAPVGAPPRIMGGGGGPGEDKLKRWAQRWLDEYPDSYPPAGELGSVYRSALPLFDDAHFSATFGRSFDRMSPGDLRGVYNSMQKIPLPRSNFPEEKAGGAVKVLERQFLWMTAQGSAQDVSFAVMARRPMHAWRQDMIKRLGALQASPTVFATIAAAEAVERRALTTWWPSDRKAFATAVVDNRTRIAGPMLKAEIDKLIASAEGLAGAHQIARVLAMTQSATVRRGPVGGPPAQRHPTPGAAANATAGSSATDIATLISLVSAETAAAEKGRLEAKIGALVAAEAAKDKAALASLGEGQAGLAKGSEWYTQAVTKYGTLFYQAQVQELLPDLARRRAGPLAASEAALAQQVRAAATTAALQGVTSRYLAVPSDRQDPAGQRIFAVADARGRELAAREQAIARAQAEAAREAASPCSRQTAPEFLSEGEPTAAEICKAVEWTYRAPQQYLEGMKGACNRIGRDDLVPALMCLTGQFGSYGGGPLLYLTSFEKLECIPSEITGQPGWLCDYVAGVRSENAMLRDMLRMFGDEVAIARFVKSATRGWMLVR
jgi:hypothetical protein